MDKKCSKYESLFVFRTEEELNQHINECPDCKSEHEKMCRVSELINEVKPHYLQKHKNFVKLKIACAAFLLIISGTTFGLLNMNTDIADTLKYGTTLSAEDLGLPVDAYGLIMVE